MATQPDANQPGVPTQTPLARRAEVLLIVLVFFIIAGDPPPHVNEAHYLARLKHYWNPAWCAGDLFLESADAQLVFVWLFGWVTKWLSLSATAWLGRLLAWVFLAWAWQRLSWRLVPLPLASSLSAALFVTLIDYAHLAGEWVVGGVESKCFAYGFVLLALADLVDRRWNRLWPLLGAATAFHPLVGGWSAVVCAGIWLLDDRRSVPFRSMLPGIIGCGALASFGIVPALMLTWNESPELVAQASRIYVFDRLPHHLALLRLPGDEITARLARHAALLLSLFVLLRLTREKQDLRRVSHFAWGAALLALAGFAIELALWNQPLVAARLQRYYWYRLTDFAAPMAVALHVTALIATGLQQRRAWATFLLAGAVVFAGWHLLNEARGRVEFHGVRVAEEENVRGLIVADFIAVPPADAKLRDYAAWVEVCEWIAENTPPDALFLTPRLNLSFKWRAGRPEVVNRKDIPQDARSILEWHRRLKDIYQTESAGGQLQPLDSLGILGTDRVRELADEYGANYALMDRGQLLSLPRVFWNEEYVVYRIED